MKLILKLSIILALAAVSGCGGGTSGTGLSNYEGQLRSVSGEPIPNATLTIVESGDAAVTDENGSFVIQTEPLPEPATILIETPTGTDSTVELKSAAEENESVHVDIILDPELAKAEATEFKVKAAIAGYCDAFFENREYIRQAVALPQGQICTLKVSVEGEGTPRPRIPVAIQTKACKADAPWINVAESETARGVHEGIVQIAFPFYSNQEQCEYRVLAPYKYKDYLPVVVNFETFAQQQYAMKSKKKAK